METYEEEDIESNSSSNFTLRMMAEGDIYNNDDDFSMTSENTSDTNNSLFSKKNKKEKNEKHKHGLVKVKYLINKKNTTFYVYNSGFIPNSYIRDAITGYKYNKKIGTKDENLFFKVIMPGINPKKREPIFLFFDSPESFERFFIMKCSTDIKNRWMKKKELLNKSLKITASDEFVL
jgi:hypothetical protein